MELQGKITQVLPLQSGVSQATGNSWQKQDYVIAYYWFPNQTQPTQMVFSVFGADRIKQFNIHAGDEVTISYHIEGHEYNGRWFNEIRCISVTKTFDAEAANNPAQPAQAPQGSQQALQQAQTASTAQQPAVQPFPPQTDANGNVVNQEKDDLPF